MVEALGSRFDDSLAFWVRDTVEIPVYFVQITAAKMLP